MGMLASTTGRQNGLVLIDSFLFAYTNAKLLVTRFHNVIFLFQAISIPILEFFEDFGIDPDLFKGTVLTFYVFDILPEFVTVLSGVTLAKVSAR